VDWIDPLNAEERADVVKVFNQLVELFAEVDLDDYYE
jgi:hypothetical protein